MTRVDFINLERTFELNKREYEDAALTALRSGWYVLGLELSAFEEEFANYLGIKHCLGVGCGLDALILAVRALGIGIGDEVIVAGNTYVATVLSVTENGATPVLVDCDDYYEIDMNLVEEKINEKTKAILTTNLYGQCSNLTALRSICDSYNLSMIEDCAQSHGAHYDGALSGTVGDISCFSFYPTKPLGAFGDGGAVVTNSDELAEMVFMLRNYGSKKKYHNEVTGINSRLDELQASLLRVGLKHIDKLNLERTQIAEKYLTGITNPLIKLPKVYENADHIFHIFAVRCDYRKELIDYLTTVGVQTQIHYPIPPHKAQCYRQEAFTRVKLPQTELYAKTELSLPIYAGMPERDIDTVIDAMNSFRRFRRGF